jgi:multiple sugar transport system permease protein
VFNFQHHEILAWLENSGIYTGGGVVLALVSALPAGYGLALTQFIGRRVLLTITLIVMIMPASALVIPLFLEMNTLHLTDTAFSVLLPLGLFPFGVYLSYIFFSSTVPSELLNAARVDGASEWGAFRRVALPLARPLVALIAFFAFVADWTNFFLPFMMFVDYSKDPISVGLQDLYDSGLPHPAMALSVLLAIAPVLVIFLVAQKTLATGMLAGATKE